MLLKFVLHGEGRWTCMRKNYGREGTTTFARGKSYEREGATGLAGGKTTCTRVPRDSHAEELRARGRHGTGRRKKATSAREPRDSQEEKLRAQGHVSKRVHSLGSTCQICRRTMCVHLPKTNRLTTSSISSFKGSQVPHMPTKHWVSCRRSHSSEVVTI